MNKETAQIIKDILDMFVSREELLKDLLKDRENKIDSLEKELKENYDAMS